MRIAQQQQQQQRRSFPTYLTTTTTMSLMYEWMRVFMFVVFGFEYIYKSLVTSWMHGKKRSNMGRTSALFIDASATYAKFDFDFIYGFYPLFLCVLLSPSPAPHRHHHHHIKIIIIIITVVDVVEILLFLQMFWHGPYMYTWHGSEFMASKRLD